MPDRNAEKQQRRERRYRTELAEGFNDRELDVKNSPGGVADAYTGVQKGAYTQSRLRQMIFGGMTRHLILSTPLPVIFSY